MSIPEEKNQRPVFFKNGEPADDKLVELAIRNMIDRLDRGDKVVIGASEPAAEGRIIAKDGERRLAIKRRATREEFLDAVPLGRPEDVALIRNMSTPFYYELELWDRVLKLSDDVEFGIRIVRHGKTNGA